LGPRELLAYLLQHALVLAELIVHIAYATHGLGQIFRPLFRTPIVDGSLQSHFTVLYGYRDFACVELIIIAQAIAHVLADAVIGTLVPLRALAALLAALRPSYMLGCVETESLPFASLTAGFGDTKSAVLRCVFRAAILPLPLLAAITLASVASATIALAPEVLATITLASVVSDTIALAEVLATIASPSVVVAAIALASEVSAEFLPAVALPVEVLVVVAALPAVIPPVVLASAKVAVASILVVVPRVVLALGRSVASRSPLFPSL